MFEGFALEMVDTGEVTPRVRRGGEGRPLLLPHGHPHTHALWHKVIILRVRDTRQQGA